MNASRTATHSVGARHAVPVCSDLPDSHSELNLFKCNTYEPGRKHCK